MRGALSADSGRGSGIESEICGNVDNGRGKMNYGITGKMIMTLSFTALVCVNPVTAQNRT